MNKLFGHEYIFNNFIELYEKDILPNKILLSGKRVLENHYLLIISLIIFIRMIMKLKQTY